MRENLLDTSVPISKNGQSQCASESSVKRPRVENSGGADALPTASESHAALGLTALTGVLFAGVAMSSGDGEDSECIDEQKTHDKSPAPSSGSEDPAPPTCSAECHICKQDALHGCSSCHCTCHFDCASPLCIYDPCEFCMSYGGTPTHLDSIACRQTQIAQGCHKCHRINCYSSFELCSQERAYALDAMPSGLLNMGNSCFLNATVQALFSPTIFKNILMQSWDEMDTVTKQMVGSYSPFTLQQSPSILQRLAVTFSAMYRCSSAEPVTPYLFLNDTDFYSGVQADACETLTRILDKDSYKRMAHQHSVTMEQYMVCCNCRNQRYSGKEPMKLLPLPLRTLEGYLCTTVQEALDAYMPPVEVELTQPCERCSQDEFMQHRFTKHHRFVRAPPVLIVSLNRWEGLGAHGRPVTLLHAVKATENVDFAGAS